MTARGTFKKKQPPCASSPGNGLGGAQRDPLGTAAQPGAEGGAGSRNAAGGPGQGLGIARPRCAGPGGRWGRGTSLWPQGRRRSRPRPRSRSPARSPGRQQAATPADIDSPLTQSEPRLVALSPPLALPAVLLPAPRRLASTASRKRGPSLPAVARRRGHASPVASGWRGVFPGARWRCRGRVLGSP